MSWHKVLTGCLVPKVSIQEPVVVVNNHPTRTVWGLISSTSSPACLFFVRIKEKGCSSPGDLMRWNDLNLMYTMGTDRTLGEENESADTSSANL